MSIGLCRPSMPQAARCGVVLNPATPVEVLTDVLPTLDFVL